MADETVYQIKISIDRKGAWADITLQGTGGRWHDRLSYSGVKDLAEKLTNTVKALEKQQRGA